ncbi:hypothetical protein ACFY78_28980 [Streptomyces olindensis]|uniref:hypothetical protein n=1 Tax=Streptomyces olindensis TaxID=358823 RepID=UPI0036A0FAB8
MVAWFRRRRERLREQGERAEKPEAGRAVGDEYVLMRDSAGELEALWIADVRRADEIPIGEILARHGLLDDVTTSRYRVVRNTFNDHGGVFVRFVGDETTRQDGEGVPRRELVVGERHCVPHEDVDAFRRDAVAGNVALLRTTIDAASASDLYPLYDALSKAFGEQAPQTRAVMRAPLQCVTCLRTYSPHLIHVRDLKREGRPMGGTVSSAEGARQVARALAMTACLDCGGEVAVWVYEPRAAGQG